LRLFSNATTSSDNPALPTLEFQTTP